MSKEQRNQLTRIVLQARGVAEAAAKKALHALGVDEADPPSHLSAENRSLRRELRAQARQLGDKEDPRKKGSYDLSHLTEKIAYDQWHRMLFARFLAENELLISPDHGVAVSLADCRELAPEIGLKDEWEVAVRFAARSLPQIFRPDDPAGKIELAPEDRASLRDLVVGLPRNTYLATDSLGWSYQFWQSERKEHVNEAGKKIGADELPAVTQLFTEDYMVDFLLDNTLGAWHAGKVLASNSMLVETARSEEEVREAVSLSGCPWKFLRFVKNKNNKWAPAAGAFDGWPRSAHELRCLDPCMGSGHFVVAMFERLVALRMAEEGLDEKDTIRAVIRENLFGLEIDPRCTQIGAFNLALAAWRRVGHCTLPSMNLACSGLAPNAKLEDWLRIAGDDQKLHRGMERLYRLFQKAPVLGSLINPRFHERDLLIAEFHELQPLLEKALARENKDETIHEMAVTARGLAKAAEILADRFTLVATNVPYLGSGKQDELLKDYCEDRHSEAKADLATCFVERCLQFCASRGSTALVTPHNWLFLGTYRALREELLAATEFQMIVRLGAKAFQTQMWDFGVSLTATTYIKPSQQHSYAGVDCANLPGPAEKEVGLLNQAVTFVNQSVQLKNPQAVISFNNEEPGQLLESIAESIRGLSPGDTARLCRSVWELPMIANPWKCLSSTPESGSVFSGKTDAIFDPDMVRAAGDVPGFTYTGYRAWGRHGIVVGKIGDLPPSLYLGEIYDDNIHAIIPKSAKHLPAIWAFVSSQKFAPTVRKYNQKLAATVSAVTRIPFDLVYWQQVAAEMYPRGLPNPYSSDPTQWLFDGHPKRSDQSLQVGMARLLGYRWPRQTGSSFPGCPALGLDGLEKFADEDGIVCINPIKGEQPALERLRALLGVAFGEDWTPGKQNELLEQVGFGGKTFEDWLRNGFFEQHCQLFHQRPFIWHIWDGRRDGFGALVNYQKLNRSNLEKLTYTFLGDWIARQKAANDAGEEGSDARLQAAQELKTKLEKIIEGEAPFDIFVRWKPLEKQPIGWEPDLNDGVRLNIRPFVEAGVLRKDPKVNWKKDRGKDVASAPWFKVFRGERINDHHLTLAEKRKARGQS